MRVAPSETVDVRSAPVVPPPDAGPPAHEAATSELCDPPDPISVAPGWRLVGPHPGPVLLDVAQWRPGVLLGRTRTRICASEDQGEAWRPVIALGSGESAASWEWLDTHGTLLFRIRDAQARLVRWLVQHPGDPAAPVAVPELDGGARDGGADGRGRLFVAGPRTLRESVDEGHAWSDPRALPGKEADSLHVCGSILVLRTRLDDGGAVHFRSFDRGVSWRPLRLAAVSLDPERSFVRCIAGTGGLEAGRDGHASHWSWDGGITWVRIPDTVARAPRDPDSGAEEPACRASGFGTALSCVADGWARMVDREGGESFAVHAPGGCSRVSILDHSRSLAYGNGCGVFLTTDRGGRWRKLSSPAGLRAGPPVVGGTGGFVDARSAWRLDGGLWWTHDDGRHWQLALAPIARSLTHGVFVDTERGVFATAQGGAVATSDGGRTFTLVLRGGVERIESIGRAVIVTTSNAVRISLDGGATWLARGASVPPGVPQPRAEMLGGAIAVQFAPGERVLQTGGRLLLERPELPPVEIARGLGPATSLVAAHRGPDGVDRVLAAGGLILERTR